MEQLARVEARLKELDIIIDACPDLETCQMIAHTTVKLLKVTIDMVTERLINVASSN